MLMAVRSCGCSRQSVRNQRGLIYMLDNKNAVNTQEVSMEALHVGSAERCME